MIEWLEYLDRVERGEEEPEYDEEAVERFKREMKKTFKNLRAPASSTVGPGGKPQRILP